MARIRHETARAALAALATLSGAWSGAHAAAADSNAQPLAIEHVTVLPMTADVPVLHDLTVVIEQGRITGLGRSGNIAVPKEAKHIDARGKFLMPALADMHVHIENASLARRWGGDESGASIPIDTQDVLLPYLANGVLQVFNLSATPESLAQRAEVESGRVLGPHMALAVMVDGNPPINPLSRVAATPEEGRKLVEEISAAGYDAVKTYTNLDLATFTAIVDEARKRKLKTLGHLPLRGKDQAAELLQPGFGMVAHAEEFAYQTAAVTEEAIPRFTELARRSHIALITTLKLNERVVEQTATPEVVRARPEMRFVHPLVYSLWTDNNRYAQRPQALPRRKQVVEFNPKLLRAFAAGGVPLVVGTDALVASVVPGFGLHDELEALAAAGLPNAAILASATRIPAEWLGVAADRGTIQHGKRANLILLDADPLADVANTRKIAAVITSGRFLERARIDLMLNDLAERYAAFARPAALTGTTGGGFHHDED